MLFFTPGDVSLLENAPDFRAGFTLLADKSIKPGDVISIGETFGWINSLGARYVSITTRDGREYLIPNEDLITGQVVSPSQVKRAADAVINWHYHISQPAAN